MESFERVRDIVHDVTGLPCEQITENMTVSQLNLDSLDLCELVMSVEDAFDVLIEDETKLHCIHDIVRIVDEQMAVA